MKNPHTFRQGLHGDYTFTALAVDRVREEDNQKLFIDAGILEIDYNRTHPYELTISISKGAKYFTEYQARIALFGMIMMRLGWHIRDLKEGL